MTAEPTPTERELDILKILWQRNEATVRQVYEEMRKELPIVQNTVQAFLRTMEEKGLVGHHVEGRAFIYRPLVKREPTNRRLASRLLQKVFEGAVDQLVQSVFSECQPNADELAKLEALIAKAKSRHGRTKQRRESK